MTKPLNTWHVYPIQDERLHTLNGTVCQCDPRVERYGDRALVIHNTPEEAKKKAN